MIATIELPWPDRDLSPNARVCWQKKHKATRAARSFAHWSVMIAKVQPMAPPVRLHMTFFPPDKRRRDETNLYGSMKAAIDGIADGIGIDDSKFKVTSDLSSETRPNGAVEVRIWEAL